MSLDSTSVDQTPAPSGEMQIPSTATSTSASTSTSTSTSSSTSTSPSPSTSTSTSVSTFTEEVSPMAIDTIQSGLETTATATATASASPIFVLPPSSVDIATDAAVAVASKSTDSPAPLAIATSSHEYAVTPIKTIDIPTTIPNIMETIPSVLDNATEPKPFPTLQICLICSILMADGLVKYVIFPFATFMIESMGIDAANVGFYVGMLESANLLGSLLTSSAWGWASDRYGRKPILLWGLLVSAISLTMFGLCKNFWLAITVRFVGGLLNGNLGVMKTAISDICDDHSVGKAFSYFSAFYYVAGVVAPILGGALAAPCEQSGFSFSPNHIFCRFPYLFPCLISSIGITCILILCIYVLNESNPIVLAKQKLGNVDVEMTTIHVHDNKQEEVKTGEQKTAETTDKPTTDEESSTPDLIKRSSTPPPPLPSIYRSRAVILSCTLYGLVAFADITFMQLYPLWAMKSVEKGGLGFDAANIGLSTGLSTAFIIVYLVTVYAWIDARYTRLSVFQIGCLISICSLTYPLIGSISNVGGRWTVLMIALGIKAIALEGAYVSVQLFISDSAPSIQLGAVNGLATAVASFTRTCGPLLGGVMWSLTADATFTFHLYIPFLLVAVIHALTFVMARGIREKPRLLMGKKKEYDHVTSTSTLDTIGCKGEKMGSIIGKEDGIYEMNPVTDGSSRIRHRVGGNDELKSEDEMDHSHHSSNHIHVSAPTHRSSSHTSHHDIPGVVSTSESSTRVDVA